MKIHRLPILLLIALLFTNPTKSVAWDWIWAHQFTSTFGIGAYGGTADASGVYLTGAVLGDLAGTTQFGGADTYVRKISPSGAEIWTRRIGTSANDSSSSVEVGDDGVYVAGTTCGAFPGYAQQGGCDAFAAKLTSEGVLVWVTQFGTPAGDFPYEYDAISLHTSGLYVAGKTRGTFPGATPAGGPNTFLARIDRTSGTVVWVRQFGAADPVFSAEGGIGADDTGVTVVANSHPAFLINVTEVRKHDFNGNVLWSRVFDTTTMPCGISAFGLSSHNGHVYLIGQTYEWRLTSCNPQSRGESDIVGLLVKLDLGGNPVWQRRIKAGTPGVEGGSPLRFTGAKVVHATDNGIFVGANVRHANFAGYVSRTPRSDRSQCGDLGPLENMTFKGFDAYVRRYDLEGNVLWTHQFGSTLYDLVSGLGTSGDRLYAAGLTRCVVQEGADPESGALVDAFAASFAINPTTRPGRLQLIVGQLETLSDAGRIASGDFGALVSQLESALASLDSSATTAAKASLVAFISLTSNYKSNGRIPSAQADAMIAAANTIAGEL